MLSSSCQKGLLKVLYFQLLSTSLLVEATYDLLPELISSPREGVYNKQLPRIAHIHQ